MPSKDPTLHRPCEDNQTIILLPYHNYHDENFTSRPGHVSEVNNRLNLPITHPVNYLG